MAEYVTKEQVIDWFRPYGHFDKPIPFETLVSDLRGMKADDVAPVRLGKWRYYHKQNIAVCTECSFERDLDANFGRAVSCPNCGARMDEEAK